MAKNSYLVNYACHNCGARGTLCLAKGKLISNALCPHCGCKTISSVPKEVYRDGNWKYPWFPGYGDPFLFNKQNPYPWDSPIA